LCSRAYTWSVTAHTPEKKSQLRPLEAWEN